MDQTRIQSKPFEKTHIEKTKIEKNNIDWN